jgi:uncharacterized repeat protein (TIGR03803 family)
MNCLRLRRRSLLATMFFDVFTPGVLSWLLMSTVPAQAQTQKVLYNFTGGHDGQSPQSALTAHAGNLYGTAYSGGLGYGTVFELSPNGGGWTQTVLYAFTGGIDGKYPAYASVVFDSAGNLYGSTLEGGTNNSGVIFELSPTGKSWTETVVYSFCSQFECADGEYPTSGPIMDSAGNIFGASANGAFELSPSGGGWNERAIYGYTGVSENSATLTMDAAGNLFGIIYIHTPRVEYSKVFELSPDGSSGWTPTVLTKFGGIAANGTLALDKAGNLYGTTIGNSKHDGTVFKLSIGKKGKWEKKTLHSFQGGMDGDEPWGGIVFDAAGNIYGTTLYGGKHGFGTVFELVPPARNGKYTEKILWNFGNKDGAVPVNSLILDDAGNLYGTAMGGGTTGNGVVFEVTP